jgi:eukaryotic-like serine/threonine-protein kinase
VTTQSAWREQSSSGPPTDDRAAAGAIVGGRYELQGAIGHGGMGTVWRATDTLLRRDVAVKEVILPPTMPQSEKDALCERTLREARAAAALSHPSVVQVYDVVTDANRPWIVMELLEARSLADMVIDDGPLAPRAVAKIGIAMLGALEVAHAAGVLHRDVKPANVLICADGRCVLTDFGVARLPTESNLTTPGMVLGSPHFISPERAVGGAFGPPSDLFSLGVTLYTAVEGGPPFDRGDPFETMRAVVEEAPRPTRLAGPLQRVLWGLLDKEPARRWSVEQARTELRELLTGTLGPNRPPRLRQGELDPTDTDPVAVIRPPVSPPPAIRSASQVGGRAMLDPDEPLTGQLARLREAAGNPPDSLARGGRSGGRFADTPRVPAPDRTGEVWSPDAATAGRAPTPRWPSAEPRREHVGRRRARSNSSVLAEHVADRVRALGREAGSGGNRSRIIVAAGLVGVLLLVGIAAWSGWFSDDSAPPAPPGASGSGASAPASPLIDAQEYRDRGIAVNVPKAWARSGAGSYVDYTDPASARWIRINIEQTGATAMQFLKNAETGLQNPSRCPAPFTEVGLRETSLGGQPGAELEYTCGAADTKRHGIWRAVVVNGNAYHFYLTVPDARFAESKIIFDEMVRSFQFV